VIHKHTFYCKSTSTATFWAVAETKQQQWQLLSKNIILHCTCFVLRVLRLKCKAFTLKSCTMIDDPSLNIDLESSFKSPFNIDKSIITDATDEGKSLIN
jgi:hypothetical protein